jgi:hypothetical protein
MAVNEFVKSEQFAALTLGMLERELILPRLIWLNGFGDFAGAKDDTISIRVPGRLTARTRQLRATGSDRNIIMDTLTEQKIDVTLTTDVYSAVPCTDEELTLDIPNFGVQILAPQVRAVAEGMELAVADEFRSAPYTFTIVVDPAKTHDSFVDARKALNDENVPFGERVLVVGSGIEAAILKDPQFVHADQSGSDAALREAFVGRIAGFDVIVSNSLDDDEGYAFHKTAFTMVTRAPVIPDGAAYGASQSYNGLAMRWLRDYDFTTTTDRSLVDCYAGFGHVLEAQDSDRFVRGVRLQLKSATVVATPATVTLAAGAKQQITVADDGGDTVPARNATYSTSDAAKATVSNSGLITAVATGSATITVTYQGHTDTIAVTVS